MTSGRIVRKFLGLLALGLAATLIQPLAAEAHAPKHRLPTIHASHHTVRDSTVIRLSGSARGYRKVTVYVSTGHGYHRLHAVKVRHNAWHLNVRPATGKRSIYRVGPRHGRTVRVTSIKTTCPRIGSKAEQVSVNHRNSYSRSGVAAAIARTICSAKNWSTITIASMWFDTGRPGKDIAMQKIIAALRLMRRYHHVRVRILVQRNRQWKQYAPGMRRDLPFAKMYYCPSGCERGSISMHDKWLAVSATVYGGPAVVSTSLNFAPQQFQNQAGSAVYERNSRLYSAYMHEFARMVSGRPMTQTEHGWHAVSPTLAYAFDPSPGNVDPLAAVLDQAHCRRGDSVGIENANVTRGRLVSALNRLRAEGCTVASVTEQFFRHPNTQYAVRTLITHDKFLVVQAHDAAGRSYRVVVQGSEDFRPYSMEQAEEQLVRLSSPYAVSAFSRWFWNVEWPRGITQARHPLT